MKKLGFSIALSMVAMTLLSLMPVMPVLAAEEIYMTPAVNPPAAPYVGYKWNVTIWVKDYNNPDVFAWQVKLNYNGVAAKINATRAWSGANMIAAGEATPNYIFAGRGVVGPGSVIIPQVSVLMGDSLLGGVGETTPPNPALLGKIEFEILGAPGKFETLTTPLAINNADTYLLDTALNSRDPIKTDGTYAWVWMQPQTLPNLAVVPALTEINPSPYSAHVIGTQFDVQVVLQNLDVGWAISAMSFALKFDTTVIDTEAANITVNVAAWDGPWVVTVTHGVPDRIDISVSTTQSLSGDVLVATITFTVMNQLDAPPNPAPPAGRLESTLDLQDEYLEDHVGPIPTNPSEDGLVYIYNYQALPPAWLSVVPPSVTLGPDLVIGSQFGKTFTVGVQINKLHKGWKMIGVDFRLEYDPTLLQVVSITEGPYMAQFAPYGTWFWGSVEPEDGYYPQHVLVGILILPDEHGVWTDWAGADPETGPKGTGILATITFKPIKQSWVSTYTDTFDLFEYTAVNTEAGDVPLDPAVDGTYTILPIAATGRVIDIWMIDPDLGGEGPGAPADLVLPQMALNLTAKVTYNWQPIAYKKVTFEIRGPMECGGQDPRQAPLWAVLQDDTCDNGHAYAYFRMPWTGHSAEDLIGVWWIGVSVTLADVVITDYMEFDYDYLIHIWTVTTNKLEYYKSNDVKVTVTFGTKSMREQTVTMYATLMDNLSVPIGIASKTLVVGGASLCHYKNYTTTVVSHVPFWAYPGMATVHVSFVWGLPSQNGEACAQERDATFYILPIHWDDPWLTDP